MDPLDLAAGSYRGTYKLVGGQSSLDLVNTVSWPGRAREHDWFDPPTNVTAWAVATGVLDVGTARRLGADPDAVRRIRKTLTAVLVPHVRRERPLAPAVDAFNRLLVRASVRRVLDADTLAWTFREPTTWEHALARVVLNAAEVLTSLDPTRLGYCPGCDWLFHDTTRNGRRTWCDMADCGSRAKSRRHYQRHHQ